VLGEAEHLLMDPGWDLKVLPFDALSQRSGRYAIQDFQITYLTSGRDLLKLGVVAPKRQGPVVIADPVFGDPEGARTQHLPVWASLPGTRVEAEAIAAMLGDASLLVQEQASETALKAVAGPMILHVASHGFFRDTTAVAGSNLRGVKNPHALVGFEASENAMVTLEATDADLLLRSGLILAGGNGRRGDGSNDGVATATEVAALDLWGTRLVVLSACETGLGEVRDGDGVYGLRRALVLAGAESQVMSLWQVSDDATQRLMVEYYRRLKRGEGRSSALRQAKIMVARSQGYAHPFFWAAFIPSGNWQTLEGEVADDPVVPVHVAMTVGPSVRGCSCDVRRQSAGPQLPGVVIAMLVVLGFCVKMRRA